MDTNQMINNAKNYAAEGRPDVAIYYLREMISQCDETKHALLAQIKQIRERVPIFRVEKDINKVPKEAGEPKPDVFNIVKDINRPKNTVTVKKYVINNIGLGLKRERDEEVDIFKKLAEFDEKRNLIFEKEHRLCGCTFFEYAPDCPLRYCECHSCRKAGGPGNCEEFENYF